MAGEPNATGASSSSIRASTWPYKRHADAALHPNILLRPPAGPDVVDDPVLAAIQSVDDSIQRMERTARLISAPWILEPPDSESFHKAAGITIPAVTVGVFSEVVRIVCPPGRNGVIREIANEYDGPGFVNFGGTIIWQLLRNPGSGITTAERNYEHITASLGAVNNPAKISAIRVFENDVFVLAVTNVSIVPAGQIIGGLLGGWFYPRTWDDQFDRQDKSISW